MIDETAVRNVRNLDSLVELLTTNRKALPQSPKIQPTVVGGFFSSPAYQAIATELCRIPPTAVGGLFKSYLLAPRR